MQDLTYVEFFAGEANVWSAVRADHNPGVPVDITYMDGPKNAMDINSDAGLAFLALNSYIYNLINLAYVYIYKCLYH